jgi:hypothetical protein
MIVPTNKYDQHNANEQINNGQQPFIIQKWSGLSGTKKLPWIK